MTLRDRSVQIFPLVAMRNDIAGGCVCVGVRFGHLPFNISVDINPLMTQRLEVGWRRSLLELCLGAVGIEGHFLALVGGDAPLWVATGSAGFPALAFA